MSIMEKALDDKIHTRQISLATYPADNNGIIVEGTLKDDRSVGIYVATGEKKPPGTIHHMILRLLIGQPGLTIQDVEVEMVACPRDECVGTMESMQRLKGLQIQSGFTAKIKELIGGNKGCAHLTHLLTVMSQAIFQGMVVVKGKNRTLLPKNIDDMKGLENLIGSCKMWDQGELKLTQLQKAIEDGR